VGPDCEGFSRKWGKSVRWSAGGGLGARAVQVKGGEECGWVKWKWGRSVRGSAGC